MNKALNEKPNAEAVPLQSSVGVIADGRYLPPPEDKDGKIWARTSALIQVEPAKLYEMWHAIENAPLWQEQIVQVTKTGTATSHWVMRTGEDADGKTLEWDSEILADEPGRRIAWRSTSGEPENAGEVIFENAPGGRGTLVTLLQEFRLGKLANLFQSIVGRNPKQAVIENLRHFKALAETGEIPRIQGQSHGPRGTVAKMKKSAYGEKIPTPSGQKRKATA